MSASQELVSIEWLKGNLSNDKLIILDASPKKTASGKVSSVNGKYIPTTRIIDIKNNFSKIDAPFPNTFPDVLQFEREARKLGINNDSEIVVYDNLGTYSSPRIWWMFKIMGHDNIKVLNGGIEEWVKNGFETITKDQLISEFSPGNFNCKFEKQQLVYFKEVMENLKSKDFLMIDARSKGRFDAEEPEPRKHLQSGHIPGSINLPYQLFLDNGKFKSSFEIKKIFEQHVQDQEKLVFTCGSGMTACIVLLAAEIAFKKSRFVYDGSWTEYAELNGLYANQ